MKLKQFIFALVAMLSSFAFTANAQVAKVGNTEYATIDEAISNWTNGTTLTLLADVTLSDVIKLNSTEHHILNLGTSTMTAASGKNAIEIVACGTGDSERTALTVDADASNPGGINAPKKSCIFYNYSNGQTSANDRPIIDIQGGVFTGSTETVVDQNLFGKEIVTGQSGIFVRGKESKKCATIKISGGTFNCTVYGAVKSKLTITGGVFNYSVGSKGDSTANRTISGGKFKGGFSFLTNGSGKLTFGNVGVYVDKAGYLCFGGEPITELSAKYPARTSNIKNYYFLDGLSKVYYLEYTSAKTNGLYYEVASMAGTGSNVEVYEHAEVVEELDNNAAVKDFTPALPSGVVTFEVEAIDIEATAEATTKVTFNVEPKNASGQKVSNPSAAITFRLPVPAAWSGKANVYHEGTLLGAYTINEESGAKYVEVSSSSFSEFSVEAVPPVAQIGSVKYATLDEAITAVQEGETITLIDNVVLAERVTIPANKTLTIDLNGKSISMEESIIATAYAINNLGNLTITDGVGGGSINARGVYNGYGDGGANVTSATITVSGGTFNAKGTNGGAAIFNYGTANVNGGKFTSIGGYSLNNQAGAEMNITDGVEVTGGIYNNQDAELTVDGGNISNNRSGCHTIYAWNAKVTVNGGSIHNENSGNATIMSAGTSVVTINGGTISIKDGRVPGNGNTWTSCLTDVANTAQIIVTGGTLNGGFRVQAGATMTINGGSFNDVYGSNYNIYGTVTVTGGTFTDDTAKAFAKNNLAAGYELGIDGVVAERVVAKIGEDTYPSLQAAIENVQEGETITLIADVETADGVVITDKNLTIDLNGKTYTVTEGASTNNRNFKINGTSVVTVMNGTMVAAGNYSSGAYGTIRTEGTANVTLTGLKLYNYRGNGLNIKACAGTTVTIENTEIYANYGGGIESAGGTIVVNNGVTVEQKGMYTAPYNSMAISVNGGGKVTVNGGTFSTECITAEEANNQGTSHGPWVAGVLNSGGTLIINGGTFFNDNFGENSLATYARGAILADTGAKIEINGGTFNALKNIVDIQNNLGDASKNPSAVLAGGTFSADPRISASYSSNLITLADGYVCQANNDGTYGVELAPTDVKVATLEELQAALADNSNELPIIITAQIVIPEGTTVELDLNGKTVNSVFNGASETNHIYALSNKGTLTIKDTKGNGSINSRGIYNYGSLTLNAGAINAIDGNGGYAVNNQSGSTFVMNGGVVAATNEDDHQSDKGGYDATALKVPADCTATLNGGTINNVCDFTYAIEAKGTLNIPATSTITVNGTHGAIYVGGGETTIAAGTFQIPADEYTRTDNVLYVSGGSLVVNGGTFIGDSDTTSGGSCLYDEAGKAVVNGGTFKGASGGDVWGTTGTTIKGGTFENLTEKQHIAEGYELDENGTVVQVNYVAKIGETKYETLAAAFAAVTSDDQEIVILQDVTENLTGAYLRGNITTENDVKVTINLTNEDWVYCPYTFVLGENITLNVPALFYYAGGSVINGTVVADAYYQRYAGTKLTINEPGSLTVKSEMCYLRYMDGDANAGIYINGDNNNETVGLNLSVAYFYQGMINAKNAEIKVGTYWQTNETDGQGSANLVLDNSTLTVTVNEHNAKATGNSTVTLKNGATMTCAGGLDVDAKANFNVENSTLAVNGVTTPNKKLFISGNSVVKIENLNGRATVLDETVLTDSYIKSPTNGTTRVLGDLTLNGGFSAAYFMTAGSETSTSGYEGTITIEDEKVLKASYGIELNGNVTLNGGTLELSGGNKDGGLWGCVFQSGEFTINTDVVVTGNTGAYAPIYFTDATATINSSITQTNSGGEPLYIGKNSVVTLGKDALINVLSVHGAGELIIDAEGMSAGEYANVKCGASGFTGTLEVINNDKLEAKIVDGKIVLAAKPVAKIGEQGYATLAEAVAAAQAGDVVTLIANVELSATQNISKSITIDGNGNTITTAESVATNNHAAFYIDGASTLDVTIKNATFDGVNGCAVRSLDANVTIDNCVFQNGTNTGIQGLVRLTQGNATVKNSKFLKNTCPMVLSFNFDAGNVADVLVVDNCLFDSNTVNGTAALYYVKGSNCTITDSEFVNNTVNCNSNGATIYLGFTENNVVTGNLFKNNTVIDASTSTRVAGAIFFGYEAEVSGNAFVNNTASNANGDVLGQVCTSTYYDCTIDLGGNYWGGNAPVYGADYTVQHQTGEGTFALNSYYTVCDTDENGSVVLSDKVEIKNVAKVGKFGYASLQAAIDAATEGQIVTIVSDITLTNGVTVAADDVIYIDLNGKTITGTPAEAKAFAVITNNGTLTIEGNGSVICNHTLAGSTSYAVNTITNCGTLTIDGATIENKSTASNQIGYAIDNNSTVADAVVTIVSGTVTVSGSNYYDGIRQFCNSTTAKNDVVVRGGEVSSIWMQNPSDGATQNTKDVNGSVTIEGGEVTALYLEPSAEFEAAIIAGHVGNVSYFQTAAGRDLTAFITGGTFGTVINENFLAWGYQLTGNAAPYGVVKTDRREEVTFIDGEFTEYTNESNIEVGKLRYVRKFSTAWTPLYAPFEIPVSKLAEQGLEVAYINGVRKSDYDEDGKYDEGFSMELIMIHGGKGNADGSRKTLKANYPYFVRSKSGVVTMDITLEEATLYAAEEKTYDCTTFMEKYEITGNCRKMTSDEFEANNYTVGASGWSHIAQGSYLNPFRFYMTVTSREDGSPIVDIMSMSIAVRGEELPDGTTVIYDVYDENTEDMIFDLQGRRVLETEKGGIYIKGGKKFIAQ